MGLVSCQNSARGGMARMVTVSLVHRRMDYAPCRFDEWSIKELAARHNYMSKGVESALKFTL
jgi:hypothetical protein